MNNKIKSKPNLKYRQGVFIVVFRKNKEENKIEYALLKRKLHWKGWEFPKGGIEKNESLLKTITRECFEETGLKPKKIINLKFSGKYNYPHLLKDRPGFIGQTYNLFAAEIDFNKSKKAGIKVDKREHYFGKWVSFDKAIKLIHWGDQKKCLRIVNSKISP